MSDVADNLLADALASQLAGQVLSDDLVERLGQLQSQSSPRRALAARVLASGRPEATLPWLFLMLADSEASVVAEAIGSIRELAPWSVIRPYAEGFREPTLDAAIAAVLPRLSEDAIMPWLARMVELHGAAREIAISLERICPNLSEKFKRKSADVAAHHYPPQITVAVTYHCNANCPYCYASVERDGHGQSITPDRFAGIIRHASHLGFRRVGFTGGEPTTHPHFPDFLRLVGEQGMTAFFATNGMFQTALVESLHPEVVGGVTAHVWFSPNFGGKREALFVANLRQMRDRGLRIMLRYNLMFGAQAPLDDLERIYRECGATQINLAITVPNAARQNEHVAKQAVILESMRLLETAQTLRKRGLRPAFAKPLPPCLPNKADWRWLGTIPHSVGTCAIWQIGGTHNALINPDGSVWPCIVLHRPLCKFEDLKSQQQLANLSAACLRTIPRAINNRCQACSFWKSHRCQGSCLAFSDHSKEGKPPVKKRCGRNHTIVRSSTSVLAVPD